MKLIVICGATASGKTALAVECAKQAGGEVVSCDAFLIYRGLEIGTAKPKSEELGGVRHHLIDVADPSQPFSVSDYERLALAAVHEIEARGKVPVLCGGTGFYMNAVLYRSAFGGVPADGALRRRYEEYARERGREALHARLAEVDPESAAALHPNDVKRVIRALEIFERTGRKKSDQHDLPVPRFPFEAFFIDYPRAELYARIDRRVDEMFAAGLVAEVRGLLSGGVSETAQSMQAIGYKEVVEGLKRGDGEEVMAEAVKKNTRNYAKRQLTFFKRTERLHAVAPSSPQEEAREVLEIYGNG